MNSRDTVRYVVVHNGRRDDYQIAQALVERELLERLVTDFFGRAPLHTSRFNAAIPEHRVTRVPAAALQQLGNRVFSRSGSVTDWTRVQEALGRRAAAIANRTHAGVVAYSGGTAKEAFSRATSTEKVLFVFHPMPAHENDILRADLPFCREIGLAVPNLDDPEQISADQDTHDYELAGASRILSASTFTSTGIRDRLSLLGLSDSKLSAPIPYGSPVPVDQDELGSKRPSSSRAEYLFLGQALQRKGLHHLLVAWRDLAIPARLARLTIVSGSGDPAILQLASDVPNVRLLPRQGAHALRELMTASDVLVLPSLVEGFGLVIPEALAHGMHVIASTNTGLADLCPPPGAAQIISPANQDDLQQAIRIALVPENRSRSASLHTARKWSWDRFRSAIAEELIPE